MQATVENFVSAVNETKSVTLKTGVSYTAGMLVTLQNDGKFTNGIIIVPGATLAGTEVAYEKQIVGVVRDAVDATSGDKVGVIITDGVFNQNKITFASTQTYADVAGILQSKNLKMEGWNK